MSKRRFPVMISALVLVIAAGQSGCGASDKTTKPSPKIMARINNYELTFEDFKDNSAMITNEVTFAENKEKAKEQLLDELIIKAVLLQEAQGHGFDKDRAFMKEIQRYWEQALLKLLIKNKIKEIEGKISVRDDEVRAEYERLKMEGGAVAGSFEEDAASIREDVRHRKVQEALRQWVETLKRNARA